MRRLTVVGLAVILFAVSIMVDVPPAPPAQAGSFTCSHAAPSSLHSIPHVYPMPGDRAAHKILKPILNMNGTAKNVTEVTYTKSGWWDPTWDFWNSWTKLCPA